MIKTVVLKSTSLNPAGILLNNSRKYFTTGHLNLSSAKLARTADDCSKIHHENLGTVNIRKATLTDYESVIAIPPHGKKFDSLADRYCAYISCNANTGYVANVDGKDVGFLMTYNVDGGSTLVLDDFRVSDNMGVKNIRESVLKYIKETRDQLIRTASVRLEKGSDLKEDLGLCEVKWNLVTKRLRQGYITPNLLKSLRSSGSKLTSATRLHSHDVIKVMNYPDSELYQNLFKDERVLKSGIPYRPITTNVSLLMDKRTLVIGSNMKENNLALFSVGTYSYTNKGLHYNLSFYGNTNEGLEEHLYVHMMSLLNRKYTKVSFEVHVEQQKDVSLLGDVLERYNMEPGDVDSKNNEVIWFETTLC